MRRLTLLTLLVLTCATAPAFGQGSLLSYKLKPAVQKGQGYPQILLETQSDFRKIDVVCDRDGTEVTMSAGATKAGKTLTFDLKQPDGEFRYDCEARGFYGTGADEFFDLPMRFSAFLGGALSINIPRDTIDKAGQNLKATSDRVVSKVQVKVYSPDGLVHDAETEMDDNEPGDELWIDWEGPADVLRLDITLFDKWGFYVFEQIFPWSLEIPHDDVHFDTGSHAVTESELPKVVKAYKDVDAIVVRYSKFVEVQLFVGGYTDTVGDRSSNQGLSERRARSIAQAFRDRGFKGKIYYQGFGENGLKIATDDGVDEILNRRAVYLLASKKPGTSPSMPTGNWKPL